MKTSHEIVLVVASYLTPRQIAKHLKATITRDGIDSYSTKYGARELRVSIRVDVVGKDEHQQRTAMRRKRIEWLEAHRNLWSKHASEIVAVMKRAGLYAPGTYWKDTIVSKHTVERQR